MPNRDATGPNGQGPCTGRGQGPCGCGSRRGQGGRRPRRIGRQAANNQREQS